MFNYEFSLIHNLIIINNLAFSPLHKINITNNKFKVIYKTLKPI